MRKTLQHKSTLKLILQLFKPYPKTFILVSTAAPGWALTLW